jgi:hypothetical protein
MIKIELEDGKYTIISELENGGGLTALRYGEEWRNLAGDKLILALTYLVHDLQEENQRLKEIENKTPFEVKETLTRFYKQNRQLAQENQRHKQALEKIASSNLEGLPYQSSSSKVAQKALKGDQ